MIKSKLVNSRKPRPGPESDLVRHSLESGFPFRFKGRGFLCEEPRIPTGFPDIVAVYESSKEVVVNSFRKNLSNQHLKVLHHIYCEKFTRVDDIAKKLNLPQTQTKNLITELFESDLIHIKGESIRIRSIDDIFAANRIVAIEAKISNWKEALNQAHMNTWFASDSYILIPSRKDPSQILATAKQFGLGVISFDGNKNKILISAEPQKIPRSYGSWLFNEWLVRELFIHDRHPSNPATL